MASQFSCTEEQKEEEIMAMMMMMMELSGFTLVHDVLFLEHSFIHLLAVFDLDHCDQR